MFSKLVNLTLISLVRKRYCCDINCGRLSLDNGTNLPLLPMDCNFKSVTDRITCGYSGIVDLILPWKPDVGLSSAMID